jgi:crotonobetainyl-CoA:carnitine CoA-transferase CaiB-like acyl-CoA transferase
LCANRNKKSVAVDISKPEGADIVRRLAAYSDVLVENFKVGGLKQYGLDHDSLKPDNPRLIYCSITGFGQTGPEAQRAGYDALIQAMGGLMSITGRADGEAGAGPQKVGVALTDIMTGLYATVAILGALEHRARSGAGQYIDLALLDVQVACLANQAANFLTTGEPPQRLGNAHPSIVPYQDFPTEDGSMMLAIGNDNQFANFCELVRRPEWSSDPRFVTNRARVENREMLISMISEITRTQRTECWSRQMESAGVPCGPINSIAEVFQEPQVRSRGMRIEIANAAEREVPLVASPLRLSETPVSYRRAPPELGEDTCAVLQSLLAMPDNEIRSLESKKIIADTASGNSDQSSKSNNRAARDVDNSPLW